MLLLRRDNSRGFASGEGGVSFMTSGLKKKEKEKRKRSITRPISHHNISSTHLHISPGEHGEDVEPPFRLFTRRPLEKVDTIGGSQSQAERVARHFLRLRHFHNTIHVDDGLGDRLRLLYKREKKKNKVK